MLLIKEKGVKKESMKNIFKKDNIRNKQVVASLFVIGLILMVVGISYAMYTFTGTGTKENVITTDEITLNHYPDSTKSRGSYLPILELSVK